MLTRPNVQPCFQPAARVAGLSPYAPPASRWPIEVHLEANEGPAPRAAVVEALRAARSERMRRYPDCAALERAIAERWGVAPERVVVTNGGDDAIDRMCRVALEPGRSLVWHTPGFEMIERSARLAGADVRAVPWFGGGFPAAECCAQIGPGVAMVSLVSPNNPTGGVIELTDIRRVCAVAAEVGALVLVDLAYVEFADDDPTPALAEIPNAVVVRTFSKAYGLAGLRVGYAIAPLEVARWMRTVGGPFPVSGPALEGAAVAMGEGPDMEAIARIRSARDTIAADLRVLGATPLESQGNFVMAQCGGAPRVRACLGALGVAVRGFPARSVLSDALRITVPDDPRTLARLRSALGAAMAPEVMLFDLDGVVADVSGSYRSAIVATAASFGVDVDGGDVARVKAGGDANNDWIVTQRLLGERGVDVPLDAVVERFQEFYLGTPSQPGLREAETLRTSRGALERIAGRVRMAVVTGRPRAEAAWFLERFGIADLFETVVAMEDGPLKPDPGPVRTALERLGVSRAWMLGDTPDDIASARGAGVVPFGIVAPGEDPAAGAAVLERAGAAEVVSSIEALEGMLG